MITKVIKSTNLRACIDYVYQEGKNPEVIDSTCIDSSREAAFGYLNDAIELQKLAAYPQGNRTP